MKAHRVLFWIATPVRLLLACLVWLVLAIFDDQAGTINWKVVASEGLDKGID